MSDKIDFRVSPSVDPETWRNIEGYNDETAPFDGGVVSVINDTWVTLGEVHNFRKLADSNGAWNEEQKVLNVNAFADKRRMRILQKIDSADRTLTANIAHTEKQLMEPLAEKAGLGTLNPEVRAHVKGLKNRSEREKFIRDALDRDDEATLSAILGAQPFLSGLDPLDRDYYLRLYHEKKRPDLVRRLDFLKRVAQRVGDIMPILHKEFTKAIGADQRRVTALKAANDAATAAFNREPTV